MTEIIEVPTCLCGTLMEDHGNKAPGFFCSNCDRVQPTEQLEDRKRRHRKRTMADATFDIRTRKQIRSWYQGGGL